MVYYFVSNAIKDTCCQCFIDKGRYKIASYATIIYFSALPDRGEDGIDIKDEFSELPFPSQVSLTSNNMSISIIQNNPSDT